MSKLETNTIDTVSGTSTLQVGSTNTSTITLGVSGDTINVPSGVTINNNGTQTGFGGTNTPAFEAYLSGDQSISDGATTKVQFNTEVFDTDSDYDNSSNYRFTPTTAGKYYVSSGLKTESTASSIQNATLFIYKNGSSYKRSVLYAPSAKPDAFPVFIDAIIDMNGSSDYLEIYIYIDITSGSARCDADTKACHFKSYKIIT